MGEHGQFDNVFTRIAQRFRARKTRRSKSRPEVVIHEISPADSHFDFPWNQRGDADRQDQIADSIKSLFDGDASPEIHRNTSTTQSITTEREYDITRSTKPQYDDRLHFDNDQGVRALGIVTGEHDAETHQEPDILSHEEHPATSYPLKGEDENMLDHAYGESTWVEGEWQRPQEDSWDYTTVVKDPITMEQIFPHVHTIYTVHRRRSIHFHEHRYAIQPIIDTRSP